MNDVEMIEKLNTIIRLQSTIIDALFLSLAQHITSQELDRIPVLDKMNEAAQLRIDLERRR